MAFEDDYGNRLTTASAAARDAYAEGARHVLGATYGARGAFERALAADEGFALAHAGLARAAMFEGDMAGAKAALARAETLSGGIDARERAHLGVFSLLLSGRPAEAREAALAHTRTHPRDALIAQLLTSVFGLIGFSGEAGREAFLLAFTERLSPHYGEDWWMMSVHAISLCEAGRIGESQALMERALALHPRNANGAHFKAHAHYEAGETEAGLRYLEGWMEDYERAAPLHGHMSWHVALWALERGEMARVWSMLDGAIGPGGSAGMPLNTLTDAAALLHRAEMAGIEVPPERWRALSDYAAAKFPASGQSFADMHAALAHAMAGEGERLARLAEGAAGFAGDLVRPVAAAWGAFARGDWAGALRDLTPVMASHERFGGSRAQRDLLELTWANLLLRLGKADEARRALATRRPVFMGRGGLAGLKEAEA